MGEKLWEFLKNSFWWVFIAILFISQIGLVLYWASTGITILLALLLLCYSLVVSAGKAVVGWAVAWAPVSYIFISIPVLIALAYWNYRRWEGNQFGVIDVKPITKEQDNLIGLPRE